MGVYKDEDKGTWRVIYRYTDYQGNRKQTQKRGFKTKREATEWERQQLLKVESSLDMEFGKLYELYADYIKSRIKLNTWKTKEVLHRKKILPYFENRKVSEITARDVIDWQNDLLKLRKDDGEPYKASYLQTIHAQLSAIFNYAVKFHNLLRNPAEQAGNFANNEIQEMKFWTKEEYLKFSDAIMDNPAYFYAFELLYWCGLRIGELRALTASDIDFDRQIIKVTKSYQKIDGEDVITPPKTKKSIRNIQMPQFICDEMKDFLKMHYELQPNERLFLQSKSAFGKTLKKGAEKAGVECIRIHDLRHSHISLLINAGLTVLDIADRSGHEAIEITFRYGHLFPTRQKEIVSALELERGSAINIVAAAKGVINDRES